MMRFMKWEYKVWPERLQPLDEKALEGRLNALGAEGWELMASTDNQTLFFKRPDQKWLEEQRTERKREIERFRARSKSSPHFSPTEHCTADACFRDDPERRKVEV